MKLKAILMGVLGMTALAAAPAFADRGHGHGHAKHHWKQAQHHQHYRGHAHYARPVVVVPPPRVVYQRPAPSFGLGTVSIRLNLPL